LFFLSLPLTTFFSKVLKFYAWGYEIGEREKRRGIKEKNKPEKTVRRRGERKGKEKIGLFSLDCEVGETK